MNEFLKEAKPVIILLLGCAILISVVMWIMGGGLTSDDNSTFVSDESSLETLEGPLSPDKLEAYNVDINNDMNPVAVFNTNKGVIEIELYEDTMPITSGNFAKLIDEGYYDGIKFHRVIEGFMIQGGDPITKTSEVLRYGTGGPGYSIQDEHINGDLLTNVRGTISMANSGPNSGGSQFFINLADNVNLDFDKPPLSSKHPVFGRVVTGMDVVDAIAVVETNQTSLPLDDIVIETATIRREA
jgi:peptidylprolyl isomerase